ncbi:MAG: hypothetical protein JSW11_08655 [Candidatus Heimdallarchaeota archaeon]|nr:MAG: hypothetical protein JSW11_08655 [Candidatus Heimdallarchaeota archaeon]
MKDQSQRNPEKEIVQKISIGFIVALTLVTLYIIFTRESISFEILGMFFFFIGGIFFIIGGTRDFFESIIITKLRGKQTNTILEPTSTKYLYGFGKPGEDIIAGSILIFVSLVCWMIVI